jgi:hypothetical protein
MHWRLSANPATKPVCPFFRVLQLRLSFTGTATSVTSMTARGIVEIAQTRLKSQPVRYPFQKEKYSGTVATLE